MLVSYQVRDLVARKTVSFPHSPLNESRNVDHAQWVAEEVQPLEPALRGYLRRQFPSIETDDVVQESYLKLLKARAAGKMVSTRAYFFSVARNTALTVFRRRRIYSDVPVNELPDWRVLDGGPDAAETTNRHLRLALAVEAIAHLPGRCREICQLAAWERLAPSAIATRLGITESTVHVQLARGIMKCAAYLRERGERE
jgi:RNA polymerase sigma-70 factor (ECF subfamily)